MRLVSLSLDAHLLEAGSDVTKRHTRYAETLDMFAVFVPAKTDRQLTLATNATVYGVGGSKLLQFFKLYHAAAAVIRTKGADVITAQDIYFLGLLGYLLARRFSCGLEVQIHGLEKLQGFRAHLARFVLKRASAVRAVSVRALAQVETKLRISLTNVTIVPVYVDIPNFIKPNLAVTPAADSSQKLAATYVDRFNVLTVARLVPVKNISLQLQALEELKVHQPNVCLHIVGDGPLRGALEAEVLTRGLMHHVVFHGYLTGTNLQALFQLADCFVLTSNSEGWGMVIIEAAQAGLPIVMTDVGCAGTVITHEREGVIITPGNKTELLAALLQLMTEPEYAHQLATAAETKVQQLPDFKTIVTAYHQSWQTAATHRLY